MHDNINFDRQDCDPKKKGCKNTTIAILIFFIIAGILMIFQLNNKSNKNENIDPKEQANTEVQKLIFSKNNVAQKKYSFVNSDNGKEIIHPLIVKELVGLPSDSTETVTTVDIDSSNKSNRFFGESSLYNHNGHNFIEYKNDETGEYFNYCYLGKSPSGVHIVLCRHCGGGSAVSTQIALLAFKNDIAIDGGYEKVFKRKRLLLHILGSIYLGDRYNGNIEYKDGILTIGPDIGVRKKHNNRKNKQSVKIK